MPWLPMVIKGVKWGEMHPLKLMQASEWIYDLTDLLRWGFKVKKMVNAHTRTHAPHAHKEGVKQAR